MTGTATTVIIEPRYNGPPTSGHGGYSSGSVAALLPDGAVQVTLRSPPPLGIPMDVVRDGAAVVVEHDGTAIAEAQPAGLDLEVPPAVPFDEAVAASASYPGFHEHLYPTCFACGPARAEGDGLRIFVGRVPGRGLGAAPWIPDVSVCGAGREVDRRVMWAALDCPGFWGVVVATGATEHVLLGRLTARIERSARPGERCVSMGWPLGRDGRKIYAGAALFGADGRLLGASSSTWIVLQGDRA